MRIFKSFLALAAVFMAAASASAQQTVPASAGQALLDSLAQDPNGMKLLPAEVTSGGRTIGEKEKITGTVATWNGPIEIRGTVDGNVAAIGGDVIVSKGGRVKGDALSVGGAVRNEGGTIDGETRTISAPTIGVARATPLTPAQAMRRSISLSVGWYLVLAVIGAGVILLARGPLDAVADALRAQPVRAFVIGVAAQAAVIPAFTLTVVALAITIIGLVVIPFAAVGLCAAGAGALSLGFLAVAQNAGSTVSGPRNGDRSFLGALQPMLFGLSFFFLLWVAGTAFPYTGGVGVALRVIGTLATWIAVSVGLGAVIMTRAGTRVSASAAAQIKPAPTAEHEWQTPTPVTGVTAARRPTPAPRRGAER